jgi:DNA-binding IclR family transcriptional regulator
MSGSHKTSHMRRLLDLLELAVVSEDGPLSLTDISVQAHVPLSTTSRLLAQLVSWGFLLDNGSGQFVPGARLVRMSVMITAHLQSPDVLLRSTRALSAATGESVTAGLLIKDTMMIVARTESEHPLRSVNRVGELISPVTAALGKAVMSRLPQERQLKVLKAAGFDDAATQLQAIRDELTTAAEGRYAVDEGTFAAGLRCRAVAILDRHGMAVGGLSIGGPAARFTREAADAAIPLLLKEADRLSLNVTE